MNKTIKRFVGPAAMLLVVVAIAAALTFMILALKAALGNAGVWIAILAGFYALGVRAFWNSWRD